MRNNLYLIDNQIVKTKKNSSYLNMDCLYKYRFEDMSGLFL